ncbi:fibroblast growth factor receptor-like 1 [Octopus bimaculoides]|uniref:fibroblast growth factor receptor-like 1 n=1 Tax=Octopus bimaculoides TaxID=37653 RepID=UPI00071C3AE0|nr:fibroblast growth factor receptor-like 1 [Octopus bimaculoides]XP_014772059.1 fibroblast growth factor receptor-like 1 [Octopus bimaculoides]XP_014772060.1 fibroblast growth factor receptor-like 1 [Octopus bimaculoides]|eukprot:XP_014772058.1 PREDICTED: fibroblast growth factor receptor-like 1 [Octopus bimaculoides]
MDLQKKIFWIPYILQWCHLFALCLAKGPPFINQTAVSHKRLIAYIGKNFRIRCPITATPPPYMQWSKDGHTINIAWERFRIQEMGLRIKDVEIEDSGLYTCKATNGFGSVQLNFTLTVIPEKKEGTQQNNLYPHQLDPTGATEPRFLHLSKMKKKSIPRPVGSSIRFRCRASGNPRPEIQWLKDGQMWTSDNMGNYQDSRLRWTLKIDDLRQEDSGQYTCVVTNIHGTINYTYSLEVVEKVQKKPQLLPPHPLNQTAQRGEQASFQCHVKSEVQPHIKWLKWVDDPSTLSNVNHTIEVKGRKFVVLKSGENWKRPDGSYVNKLTLKRITSEDSGLYICLGATSLGISSRQAFLKVHPDPKHYRPNQKIPPSTSGIPLLAICIPLVMLAIIIGAVFLGIRCHGCCSQTSHNSNHQHVQHLPVPTSHHEYPVNYPQMSAYHTPNIHAGSSSMSGSSSCRVASSSIPPLRH